MNTSNFSAKGLPAGSTLLVTLLVTLLLGVVLASYLLLVRAERVSTARSQAWHQALALAEAGVEEALTQLNPPLHPTAVSAVPAGNGWTAEDGFSHPNPPERSMLGGSYSVLFTETTPPTIYATGYTRLPVDAAEFRRVLQVQTTNAPLFANGLSAESSTIQGNGQFQQDRYDSGDPDYNTGGNYDPARAKPTVTTNIPPPPKSVLPEIAPPFITGLPLPSKHGSVYLFSGDYFIPDNLALGGNDQIQVPDNRSARIYVLKNLTMSGRARIQLGNQSTLQIFVAGGTARLNRVDNDGPPINFQYFALPGNTNLALNQDVSSFSGIIYAPAAAFSYTGPGTTLDYVGALTVKSFLLNRAFYFHFDEQLVRAGPRRGFLANSWREL